MANNKDQRVRARKLLDDALEKVSDGSKTIEEWIEHLDAFLYESELICQVNYDDPRWQIIDHSDYDFVQNDIVAEDFPILGKGTAEVCFECLDFSHDPTNQEILETMRRRGLRRPDRAEAETFMEKHFDKFGKGVLKALCGLVFKGALGKVINLISFHQTSGRMSLNRASLDGEWVSSCRFLTVRESKG